MSIDRSKIIIIFICVLMLAIFFGPCAWIYIYSICFGRQEILRTAAAIASNETDIEIIVNKIADWQKDHMKFDTRQCYFYPMPPFLFWRKPHPDPTWVISIKRGGCEEYAILFAELARSVNIQSRVVYNPGEDHVWCEVMINDSWVHFDPLEKRFNDTGFYERSRDLGGWGKQLSYVYFVGLDDNKHDITNRYTNTGRLIVRVEKDNLPVENAKIVIRSRFLMETNPMYKGPLVCMVNYTDRYGTCVFNLGGNNYTITAKKGTIIGYRENVSIDLKENSESSVTLHLSDLTLLLSIYDILVIVLLLILFSVTIILIYKKSKYRLHGRVVEGQKKGKLV